MEPEWNESEFDAKGETDDDLVFPKNEVAEAEEIIVQVWDEIREFLYDCGELDLYYETPLSDVASWMYSDSYLGYLKTLDQPTLW